MHYSMQLPISLLYGCSIIIVRCGDFILSTTKSYLENNVLK